MAASTNDHPDSPAARLRRTLERVGGRLRSWWSPETVPVSIRDMSPTEGTHSLVPVAYMPLYTYLEHRYAGTVVLTFEQIEALLGFTPPSPAFADATWWTGVTVANDGHSAAWTAAHRAALPQLNARIVTFQRLS